MRRIWAEQLTPEAMRDPAVLRLLGRFDIHPILAVHPETNLDELARWIGDVRTVGLEAGIWPLLPRTEGYWPSERNVPAWARRVHRVLDAVQRRDQTPTWLAVDLEPPIGQVARLLRRPLGVPAAALDLSIENMDLRRYRRAERQLNDAVSSIAQRGVRTLGVTLPLAAHDLAESAGPPFWQDMFETPWEGVAWDAAGIMAYGSIVSGASGGLFAVSDARAMHQRLLERVGARFGRRAHASVGVTGAGVFGDEPAYDEPDELRLDVAAALAAGITDIAAFCLEGVLARPTPEAWLAALRDARPLVPSQTWRSRVVRVCGAALRRAGRTAFGR